MSSANREDIAINMNFETDLESLADNIPTNIKYVIHPQRTIEDLAIQSKNDFIKSNGKQKIENMVKDCNITIEQILINMLYQCSCYNNILLHSYIVEIYRPIIGKPSDFDDKYSHLVFPDISSDDESLLGEDDYDHDYDQYYGENEDNFFHEDDTYLNHHE